MNQSQPFSMQMWAKNTEYSVMRNFMDGADYVDAAIGANMLEDLGGMLELDEAIKSMCSRNKWNVSVIDPLSWNVKLRFTKIVPTDKEMIVELMVRFKLEYKDIMHTNGTSSIELSITHFMQIGFTFDNKGKFVTIYSEVG